MGDGDVQGKGLRLEPGTITVLLGPNGAGKTTLLEKIAGLREPENIQVLYGTDWLWKKGSLGRWQLNEEALLQYSYCSQSPEDGLFARSVRDELDYSLRPYALSEQERAERRDVALAAVGWDSSWETRDPYLMSGGERRRAALASVFATPAAWLLLDEPTAGLDGSGHERIADHLKQLRAEGRGIVLVSHDSDWAIPLADRILLWSADGSARLCGRDELLAHPEWLEQTGMTIPNWLRIAHLLGQSGVSPEKGWNPQLAAAEWDSISGMEFQMDKRSSGAEIVGKEAIKRIAKEKMHRLAGFDPRAVWLAYLLVSTGLFFLRDWVSMLVGAVVVAGLLIAGRISLRKWQGLIVNYAIFSIVTSTIFAWGASSGGGFEWEAFAGTLFPFARTMLILLLGLAIPLVMSPLSLRRSLEQLTTFKGKTPQGIQRFILTVTLMMRFVPVLLELWGRFAKIFLARGKTRARNPVAYGRKLRDVAIPFLLALFRLGDEVALALESRGVGVNPHPTRSVRLKWRMRDYGFTIGAIVLAVGLWGFAHR